MSAQRCMGNTRFSSVSDINNDEKRWETIRKKRSLLLPLFSWWFPVAFGSSSAMIYRCYSYDFRARCFRLQIKEPWVESRSTLEVLRIRGTSSSIGRWSTSDWKLKYFWKAHYFSEVLLRYFGFEVPWNRWIARQSFETYTVSVWLLQLVHHHSITQTPHHLQIDHVVMFNSNMKVKV
jgi:hypothetical protein